jgi:hypothetical protein
MPQLAGVNRHPQAVLREWNNLSPLTVRLLTPRAI